MPEAPGEAGDRAELAGRIRSASHGCGRRLAVLRHGEACAADARVIDVEVGVVVGGEQRLVGEEEHVVAVSLASRNADSWSDSPEEISATQPAGAAAAADALRLVLVDVLPAVAVVRDEGVGAVEEQPSFV